MRTTTGSSAASCPSPSINRSATTSWACTASCPRTAFLYTVLTNSLLIYFLTTEIDDEPSMRIPPPFWPLYMYSLVLISTFDLKIQWVLLCPRVHEVINLVKFLPIAVYEISDRQMRGWTKNPRTYYNVSIGYGGRRHNNLDINITW